MNTISVTILMWFIVVVYVKMIKVATHNMPHQNCCEASYFFSKFVSCILQA